MHNINGVRVKGNSGFIRDVDTKAILNTNSKEYENYIRKKESLMSDKKQLQAQAEEINNIKQDLSQIKQMLSALLEKIA